MGGEKLTGSGELTWEIQFRIPGGGKSGPQMLGQKLGKSLRIPRIDLEIRRKSTISDGSPDDSAETLRKSLIAVLGIELRLGKLDCVSIIRNLGGKATQ